MKKVLLIAFYYNQKNEVGSIRMRGLAKYLHEFGWEPTILTVKSSQKSNSNFKVIETDYIDLRVKWKEFLGFNPEKTVKENLNSMTYKNKKTMIERLLYIWEDIFSYPDAEKYWYKFAVEKGKELLKNENYDAIISSSSPVTSHLIANKLKKEFNIPWIADFRDLWTQNHYYPHSFLRKFKDRKLELGIISNADILTTVSKPLARNLKKLHNKEVYEIPNGYDIVNDLKISLSPKFNIVYTGTIYPEKMDPEPFLKALNELIYEGNIDQKECEVNFYGINDYWLKSLVEENSLESIVKFHGWIDINIVVNKQKEAQLLLLLNWNDPNEKGVYTGKVFEYLAAKRPIISIGPYNGVIGELLNETNAGINLSNINEIKKELMRTYSEYKVYKEVKYRGIPKKLNKYHHKEMTKKFVKVLELIT